MTVRFKFAEPVNRSVVELDPDKGYIETSKSQATITYRMNTGSMARAACPTGPCPPTTPAASVLSIDEQIFEADDIDELISFLETVRDRLRGIS